MTEQNDNLAAWSALLQQRMGQLRGAQQIPAQAEQANRLASAINALFPPTPHVFTVTVQSWLEGKSAPATPELYKRLMRVLRLPETLAPASPEGAFRQIMEQFYRDIPDSFKADNTPVLPPIPRRSSVIKETITREPADDKKSKTTGDFHAKRGRWGRTCHDDPALPARLLVGNTNYDQQDAPKLEAIMKETLNAHEYLCCFRALMTLAHEAKWSQERIAKIVGVTGSTFGTWEAGPYLPGRGSLMGIRSIFEQFKQAVPVNYDRFEQVLIANRLAIVSSTNDPYAIENQFSDLPVSYWIASLEQCNNSKAWDALAIEDKPLWVNEIRPLETQGDYLRAVRHAFGFTYDEVGAACGVSPDTVKNIEGGQKATSGPMGNELENFYEKTQEKITADQEASGTPPAEQRQPLFNRAVYENLPATIWKHSEKRGKERAAKRAEREGRS